MSESFCELQLPRRSRTARLICARHGYRLLTFDSVRCGRLAGDEMVT